jgi:hypothetical protein
MLLPMVFFNSAVISADLLSKPVKRRVGFNLLKRRRYDSEREMWSPSQSTHSAGPVHFFYILPDKYYPAG